MNTRSNVKRSASKRILILTNRKLPPDKPAPVLRPERTTESDKESQAAKRPG